jgi:hypothetical protein
VSTQFQVKCDGLKFAESTEGETCGAAEEASAATAFQNVHDAMMALGFKSPRLYRENLNRLFPPLVKYGPYQAKLLPCSLMGNQGLYKVKTAMIEICLGPNGFDQRTDSSVRHEYFHAIQHAYWNVHAANLDETRRHWERVLWFEEGQAATAAFSGIDMSRDGGNLVRVIDLSLLEDRNLPGRKESRLEYQAQDFWVYLGKRLGRGLTYLIPFLEGGSLPADVDETLQNEIESPDLPDLRTAFWEWSKNQAFEKALDLGNGVLGGSCDWNSDVATAYGVVYDPHDSPPASQRYPLDPLDSVIVNVKFEAPASYTAYLQVETSSADVLVKTYEDDKPGCEREPEEPETRVDVQTGTQKNFYVLITNTSFTGAADVRIGIEPLRVSLSPPTITLRGTGGDIVPGAFALTNLSSKPVVYSAFPNDDWLELSGNASGTLAPNATILVDFTATCATSGGTRTGTIDLEFSSESGVVLTDNNVPRRVTITLECGDDCTRLTRYPQLPGSVSFSWSDVLSYDKGLDSNDLQAGFNAGGAVVLLGGGAGWGDFGSVSSVLSNVTARWNNEQRGRPPHSLTILESGNGSPVNDSSVSLLLNRFTCSYTFMMRLVVPGEETRIFDGRTTSKKTTFTIEVRVEGVPVDPTATEISGSMSVPFTGKAVGTYFGVGSFVTGNLISIKPSLGQAVSAASVTWFFTLEP